MTARVSVLELVAVAGFTAALAFAVLQCAGVPAPMAAEAAYTADLMRCVDQAATLAASKACRAGVDAKWGVDGGRP